MCTAGSIHFPSLILWKVKHNRDSAVSQSGCVSSEWMCHLGTALSSVASSKYEPPALHEFLFTGWEGGVPFTLIGIHANPVGKCGTPRCATCRELQQAFAFYELQCQTWSRVVDKSLYTQAWHLLCSLPASCLLPQPAPASDVVPTCRSTKLENRLETILGECWYKCLW